MPAALVAGAATTAYYAVPDLLATRRARGLAKAGCLALALVASGPEWRTALTATPEGHDGEVTSLPEELKRLPTRTKVLVAGAAVGVLVGSTVLGERWIFRRGQARAAAGKRLPHTRAALVFGALTFGLSLVETPAPAPADV